MGIRPSPTSRPLTILLALVLVATLPLPPAAAQGDAGAWTLDDPAGDQTTGMGLVGAGPSAAAAHADLLEVRIENENEVGFELVYRVARLQAHDEAGLCCTEQTLFIATFTLQGTPIQYRLTTWLDGQLTGTGSESTFNARWWSSELCLVDPDDGRCFAQPVATTLDSDAGEVRLGVPKSSLLGLEPYFSWNFYSSDVRPPGTPANLPAGSQLLDLAVESHYTPTFILFPATFTDRAPDEGTAPPYTFRTGTANQVVRIHLEGGNHLFLPVQAGANQSIQFFVENTANAKRMLAMDYTITGPPGAVAHYRAWGPATVTVPGQSVRAFTLSLDVSAGADITQPVELAVRGVSVVDPNEIGLSVRPLLPGGALGPDANTLRIHAQGWTFVSGDTDPYLCNLAFMWCGWGFLSPLETHPWATPGGFVTTGGISFGNEPMESFWIWSDVALPNAIAFADDGTIEMDLHLAGRVGGQARVHATLVTDGDVSETLFDETVDATLSTGGGVVTLSGPARFLPHADRVLAPGTSFLLRVEVYYPIASTGAAEWALGGARLMSDGSQIRLPLVELPDEYRRQANPAPFQLSVIGDREDFVNPGKARLYNVSVLNQGDALVRIALEGTIDADGWRVQLVPGSTFRLDPGDAVTLGVLVHAPDGAREGDVGTARLNATAEGFDTPVGLVLRAIITHFDLPDDALAFHVDPDDEAKFAEDGGGKTPAAPLVAGLVAVAGLAAALRRPRGPPGR